MNLEPLKMVELIETLENYLTRVRPPEHIRPQLDIGYRIEDQSVFIFEIRPVWNNPKEIQHLDMAKTTFVIAKNEWKVFWMRGNLKWDSYKPKPVVKSLKEFIKLVEEDKNACFWG
jgi:Protein of unknown function (DUF3024)